MIVMQQSKNTEEIHNPFATRYTRPGAIDYRFEPHQNADVLFERLIALGGRAQIIGQHGCGKSTLIAALARSWCEAGHAVFIVALRDGMRRMPRGWHRQAARQNARVVVVDGYEQLGFLARWMLKTRCALRGWLLLITTHRACGLPTLLACRPTQDLFRQLVRQLTAPAGRGLAVSAIDQVFARSGGNVREALFHLYDEYERASCQH